MPGDSRSTDGGRRLDPAVFDLPVQELRRGYRSAIYFWRTKRILELDDHHARVTIQLFQKNDNAVICGTDEAIAILKTSSGYYTDPDKAYKLFDEYLEAKFQIRHAFGHRDYDTYLRLWKKRAELSARLDDLWVDGYRDLEVRTLRDGERLDAYETAMLIEGDYHLFAHLESLYLGVLARRTRVATNVRRVVEAANGKPVLFFADRFDHYAVQGGDGYASYIGGSPGVATDAMAAWFGEHGLGTMPHGLIAAYNGDTVLATEKFSRYMQGVPLVSLVDFDNNCPETALNVARALGEKLYAVRLDTSESIADFSIQAEYGADTDKKGVCPELVFKVRETLDRNGFEHVKIIVSGGFNPDRIRRFEEMEVPVDSYAVGSWIMTGRFDYTADVVRVNNRPLAKVGRRYKPSDRLKLVTD